MQRDSTEYFSVPTCWQYKAEDYADISNADLAKEVAKPYARELISQGYGYRLAICDSMPAAKQTQWETFLTAQVHAINPQAPAARVATTAQLSPWTNMYPSLIPAHFRRDLGPALFFDAWRPNITKATPSFVDVPAWEAAGGLLSSHIDLGQIVRSPIITLQGFAGVGKTRLTYEVLAKLKGASALTLPSESVSLNSL